MYQPRHFNEQQPAALQALINAYPLATVILATPEGIEANPVPLLYQVGDDGTPILRGHVAAGNPLAQAHGQPVIALFHGPDAYVSPNWYPSKADHHKAVPTWNYALVEVRGTLQTFTEPTRLEQMLRALTARFERPQPRPWSLDDAPTDYRAAMYKAIVGIDIPVASMTGKFKLSQNRSGSDIAGVMEGLRASNDPRQIAVADAMAIGHSPIPDVRR